MTLHRDLGDGLKSCWLTPVYLQEAPDTPSVVAAVNAALAALILKRSEEAPGISTSNVGAWQGPADLLRSGDPAVHRLVTWIEEAAATLAAVVRASVEGVRLKDPRAEAWGVRYRAGDAQTLHVHPGSVWSGVYYVRVPRDLAEDEGVLELLDPRPAARARGAEAGVHRIVPREGLLVAFPSWLEHQVRPHRSKSDRLCIAFNVGYGA